MISIYDERPTKEIIDYMMNNTFECTDLVNICIILAGRIVDLETKIKNNPQINSGLTECQDCGGPLDNNLHCKYCDYPDDIKL